MLMRDGPLVAATRALLARIKPALIFGQVACTPSIRATGTVGSAGNLIPDGHFSRGIS